MSDSRVFMPQRPVVRNNLCRWVDKYDLSPAERFGRLVSIVPVGQGTSDVSQLMQYMDGALQDFSDSDCLLAVGDPFLIAMSVMVAARHNGGRVRLLKWHRDEGEYRPYLVMA